MRITAVTLPRLALALGAVLLAALSACSDGGGTEPAPPPAITIQGVQDGASYEGPVTIRVRADRGSMQVTLDGSPVLRADSFVVSAWGDHLLAVLARDGGATARDTVRFAIRGGSGSSVLIVRMLSLGTVLEGGGDAILLTDSSAAGQFHALVDAGPVSNSAADDYVADRLDALGVDTLQLAVLTHAHFDHYGGMPAVLQRQHVRRFVYSGQVRTATTYGAMLSTAQRADSVIVMKDRPLRRYTLGGGAQLSILPPLPAYLGGVSDSDPMESSKINNGSVGVLLEHGGGAFRMFLTGDGQWEANSRWMGQFAPQTQALDVLKVGHHAANNAVFDNELSGTSAWLAHTRPALALVSANGRSHPRIGALNALLAQPGMKTYCTHVHGDLTLRVAPTGSYTIAPQKNATQPCVAGTDANS